MTFITLVGCYLSGINLILNFWEKVPVKYKLDQKLYKETLKILNFGGVWTDNFQFSKHISKWMILIRLFFKAFFLFIGKKEMEII